MILVTGGTGLIGSHLLLELIKKGEVCRATRRKNSDLSMVERLFRRHFKNADAFQSIEWVEAEVLDIHALDQAMKGVSVVFHCAAMVSFFSNDSERMKRINVHGTRYLVNLALEHKVSKFVFVSSTASIGKQEEGVLINEEHKWQKDAGNSNYGLSKYLSELEVWRASEEGLDAAIVNPSIVIGPGNWEVSSPLIFSRVNKGLKFFTPGGNAFVDVRDVVEIMLRLGFSSVKNQRYLLCSENLRFKEIFSMVAESLGKKAPSVPAGYWMANLARYADNVSSFFLGRKPFITKESLENGFRVVQFSNEKVRKEFGFEFRPISEAVSYTAAVFREEHSQ